MKGQCIFFDIGQTLINEWSFFDYFDQRFLELLNGFGTKIDKRNYQTVRHNVIRNRMIGSGGINELIIEVCRLVCNSNYGKIILKKLEPEIREMRAKLFRLFDDAKLTIGTLVKCHKLGVIANQPPDVVDLLQKYNVDKFFDIKVISSIVKMVKPSLKIYQFALNLATYDPENCIMVGDRLDTDIYPANKLGMRTIRTTNSIFKLQEPINKYEYPTYTVAKLGEIPRIVDRIN